MSGPDRQVHREVHRPSGARTDAESAGVHASRALERVPDPDPAEIGGAVTGVAALDAGIFLARQRGAHEVLVLADTPVPIDALTGLPKDIQLIFGVADEDLIPYYTQAGILAILSPGHFSSALSRVQYAIFRARAAGLLPTSGHVICVSAPAGAAEPNAVIDVDLTKEFEEASRVERYLSERGGRIDILTTLLDVAIEIGMYGFEGKPVGTILVYGDESRVLKRSRQLTFNPYRGYAAKSRNVALGPVRESLKIFARMDGAIIVDADGNVAAAGRYLLVPPSETPIVRGRGTRHQAAAFITRETRALAIVVSETGGRVTLFSRGKTVFDLAPRSAR
jgi:DNA integrity scanning protein DisA with diadenylate cyclase activity